LPQVFGETSKTRLANLLDFLPLLEVITLRGFEFAPHEPHRLTTIGTDHRIYLAHFSLLEFCLSQRWLHFIFKNLAAVETGELL
jgi:hypothetical protein